MDAHIRILVWQINVGDAFLLSWKICDGLLPGFHNFKDTQHGLSFYEFDEHQRLRAQKRWKGFLEQDEDWEQQNEETVSNQCIRRRNCSIKRGNECVA